MLTGIGVSLCQATLGPNSYVNTNDNKQNINEPHTQPSTSAFHHSHHASSGRNKHCPKTVFIVSTMDGKVQALDARDKGKKLWSVQADTQPLLSSSISKLELTKDGVNTRLIPALDGSLYQYDGDNLEALPVSSETLLSSTFRINDDTMMIGGKAIRNYGIDMISGQLRYACSMSGCQRFGHTDTMTEEEELIVITRNTQTVRAVDSRNGLEKWNFSVGNHEVNYVGAMPNKMMEPSDEDDVAVESEIEDDPYLSCSADIGEMKESSLKVILPEGLVFYVNPDNPNHILWEQKLSSPVANAWLFHHNRLKPISLFSRVHIPTISGRINPVMYIGHHQNQMYVQVSSHVTNEIIDGSTLGKIPSVYWKPYLASSCSRTPTLRPNKNNGVPLIGRKTFKRKELQNTAVAVRQQSYPFDDGYYLFPDFTLILPDKEKEVVEDYKGIFESSLLIWWKEVAFISIITAVVFNLAVFCFARFEASRREQSDNVQNNSNPPEQDEEKTEELLLTNKMKDEVTRPDSLPLNSPAEYVSKYYTDFEHLERLNHGAYGVVFVAKNKFDSCQYAVKRICLPKCTESEEKVMREVTTLANLDHVGIVRYFQSWFECPPFGWQEKIDREMGSSGCITPSVTTQNTSPTESPVPHIIGGACLNFNPLKPFKELDFENLSVAKMNGLSNENLNFGDENSNQESGSFSMTEQNPSQQMFSTEDSEEESENTENILPFGTYSDFQEEDIKSDESSSIIFKDSGFERGEQIPLSPSKQVYSSTDSTSEMLNAERKCQKSNSSGSKPKSKTSPKMYLYIQMQLCKRETLKDWLSEHTDKRNCEEVLDFFDQIVTAVEYVHKKGVLHRDLKPSNIFFSMEDVIKVGDFGLATAMTNFIEAGEESLIEGEESLLGSASGTQYKRHTGGVGTELYMSPELLDCKAYNQKVDIFSLGMILFELLYPFKTESERRMTLYKVKQQKYPKDFNQFIPDFFDKTIDLLNRLLSSDPDERPSASEILDSDLMTDFAHSKVPRRFRNRTFSSSSSGAQH